MSRRKRQRMGAVGCVADRVVGIHRLHINGNFCARLPDLPNIMIIALFRADDEFEGIDAGEQIGT